MRIHHSFPALSEADLRKEEAELKARFGLPALPADYRKFLLENNGGLVSPGPADATREADHSHEVVFDTPLVRVKQNNQPVRPSVVMFFGIPPGKRKGAGKDQGMQVYDLVASNAHSREDFDVLPDRMLSIAQCSHPDAADMLCISLRKGERGSVFYFNEFWDRPAKFFGTFFEDRTRRVVREFGLQSETDFDEDTRAGRKIKDELKRVPFVKVADTFAGFLKTCRIVPVAAS